MIESCGHQTIEKTAETIPDRLKEGPVKSLMFDDDGKPKKRPPFAGTGYYFWEDNINASEWWGGVHYKKSGKDYRIFKIDIDLKYDNNEFLDLIGSRQHLKLIENLVLKTKGKVNCSNWKFHNYISYFRILEAKQKGIFPYKMVRFNDYNLNPKIQNPLQLNDQSKVALMNPFYIVCVFEKDHLKLDTFTFIK
jgi:hypothetical protein